MMNCPCCSEKTFNECCEPILNNESASTALALMRSRYTAYQCGKAEYLYNTTHSKTRLEIRLSEIAEWSEQNEWTKLEILDVQKGELTDNEGTVEFKAFFSDKNASKQVHHERSSFLKESGKWMYLDGIANPPKRNSDQKIGRNEPCPCGNGKKYKKCCA